MPSAGPNPCVGILWRGRPGEPPPPREQNRLKAIFAEFEARGARTEALAFSEEVADDVRRRLAALDAVLTWVDPIVAGRDRSVLDAMLREVASRGVYVSAHPDVILKMGTKNVLVRTKDLAWGSDTFLLSTPAACLSDLPARLRAGPRVLKQYRGSSGDGVWKIELEADATRPEAMMVAVRHALRGSRVEHTSLGEFIERSSGYFQAFGGAGSLIDQPYQERVTKGMTRAYLAGDRVAGFGHQFVTALAPLPEGTEETPPPPPRYYFGPDKPEFQDLRSKLEGGWVAEMQRLCDVKSDDLPAIWDADFLLGPKTPEGEDSYVLCEINISGVFPIPDESVRPLVSRTLARVRHGAG